jgi:8-oxo-dGTP diphosphatase
MKPGIDYIGVGVGALIFNDEGKIFLSLRGPLAKNERGKWEIPGGAVEYGETIEDALQREVLEEIGVKIRVKKLFRVCNHLMPDEHQHWVSPTYICEIVEGTPKIMEPGKSSELRWFTLEEAEKLPLSIIVEEDIKELKKINEDLINES